jgi:hypothetical protein
MTSESVRGCSTVRVIFFRGRAGVENGRRRRHAPRFRLRRARGGIATRKGRRSLVRDDPAGEQTKTIATVSTLWSAFLKAGIERGDAVIALGGRPSAT